MVMPQTRQFLHPTQQLVKKVLQHDIYEVTLSLPAAGGQHQLRGLLQEVQGSQVCEVWGGNHGGEHLLQWSTLSQAMLHLP